jgi:gas vesicle protein
MSKQNSTGTFIGGFIIGSAVGTVLGLLVAPRTGKETRKVIKKSADALPEIAEDLTTSFQLQANRLSESTLKNWDITLNKLQQAIAAGVEASRETSQATKSKTAQEDLNSSIVDREAYPKGNRF